MGIQAEVKLRIFIPAEAVLPVGSRPSPLGAYGGDFRGFEYASGTSRAEYAAKVEFDLYDSTHFTLSPLQASFGETRAYRANDVQSCENMPGWACSLRPGAVPSARKTLAVNALNLAARAVLLGPWGCRLFVHVKAANPLMPVPIPAINADFVINLQLLADRVINISQGCKVSITGRHDRFPAYELYVNGTRVYEYDPIQAGHGPLNLFTLPGVNTQTVNVPERMVGPS